MSSAQGNHNNNNNNNVRNIPFSNMSEEERQRRYDEKMAQISLTTNDDGQSDVSTTAAVAASASVAGNCNNNNNRTVRSSGINHNRVFANMPEEERQRRYNAKMAEMGVVDNDQTNSTSVGTIVATSSEISEALPLAQRNAINDDDLNYAKEQQKIASQPTSYRQHQLQQEMADGELAVAMAINEEDEEMAPDKIAYAIEYDPDSKPPLVKNRRFQLYGIIGCILLVVVAAGAGIAVSSSSKDTDSLLRNNNDNTPVSPTDSPTIFLNEKESKVYSFLMTHFSDKVVEVGTPHQLAAEWILNKDPLSDQMTKTLDAAFMQRYVLAFLWYHSTENGAKPWRSCNPKMDEDDETDAGDTCTFLKWERLPNDKVCFSQVEGANRWMSGVETCKWQGVDCSTGTEVLGVDLFFQGMSGSLPTELVALTSLQKIAFAFNELTGVIPSEYAQLRTLLSLELHGNLLTGSIPDAFYEAASDTGALVLLNVGDNQLDGILDTRIGLMTDLKGLHFFDNRFIGTIPTEIGLLRYLSYSRGYGNQLSGGLPTELGEVRQLGEFWYNQCGLSGTIPSEIGRMKRMKDFRLWGNDISGLIPEEFYEMTNMERLSLQENALEGTISTAIGDMQFLKEFRISSNQLTGTVPTELGSLSALIVTWVHQNNMNGEMPEQICSLRGLLGLQADCEPQGAASVECSCCSSCCEQGLGLGTCFFREGFGEPTLPPSVYDGFAFCDP